MKRAAVKIAYLLLAFAFVFVCGCSVKDEPAPRPAHVRDAEQYDPNSGQAIVRYPLTIITKRMNAKGAQIRYPYVCDDGMEILNISIHSAFTDFAVECETEGSKIGYTTEFNRFGLLSLTMTCTSPDGRELYVDTANFDTDTGKRVYLSSCFGSASEQAAEKLIAIVEGEAERLGATVLGELPSFDDGTRFLFTFGGIYLVFREYEVFSAEAGAVKIKVPYAAIYGTAASDGLMNRLK